MSDDPLEKIHLSLMQDVLPIGMAILDRAKKGGVGQVSEAFSMSDKPLADLRVEGEPSSKIFRDNLDKVFPGLGNPVMSVDVSVESGENQLMVDQSLIDCLNRISQRLQELDTLLSDEDINYGSELVN